MVSQATNHLNIKSKERYANNNKAIVTQLRKGYLSSLAGSHVNMFARLKHPKQGGEVLALSAGSRCSTRSARKETKPMRPVIQFQHLPDRFSVCLTRTRLRHALVVVLSMVTRLK